MVITIWTVRVAALLYAVSVALQLTRGSTRLARWLWSLGLFAYLIHVACAFQFHHGWSHAAAYRETARQTGELFGVYWGGGLYLNYLFSVVWLADVVWSWRGWARVATHAFLAFMFFNATVVFGRGPVQWLGLVVSLVLVVLWWRSHKSKTSLH